MRGEAHFTFVDSLPQNHCLNLIMNLGQIPAERHLPKYLPRPFRLPRSLKTSQSERPSQTGGAKETGQEVLCGIWGRKRTGGKTKGMWKSMDLAHNDVSVLAR